MQENPYPTTHNYIKDSVSLNSQPTEAIYNHELLTQPKPDLNQDSVPKLDPIPPKDSGSQSQSPAIQNLEKEISQLSVSAKPNKRKRIPSVARNTRRRKVVRYSSSTELSQYNFISEDVHTTQVQKKKVSKK